MFDKLKMKFAAKRIKKKQEKCEQKDFAKKIKAHLILQACMEFDLLAISHDCKIVSPFLEMVMWNKYHCDGQSGVTGGDYCVILNADS